MLIINDFFKRKKEAVSNQMEALLGKTGGKIIAATRFMGQKALQKADIKDNIYIYNPFFYQIVMTIQVLFSKENIHVFEEESNKYKEWLFNVSNKDVYVSMYRKPFPKYVEHLKRYKNLKGVFVELDEHRETLIQYGLPREMCHITPTPAKVTRKKNKRIYNPNHVNLLFASWNNMEKGDHLKERGLIYLLDLLTLNPNMYLTILLRDNKTKEFIKIIGNKGLSNRVNLVDITEDRLETEFDNCDFVVFTIQKTLTKDVPNSLIDGLSRGKPLIITNVFGISKYIIEKNIGIVLKPNTKPIKIDLSIEEYTRMSNNAYLASENFTKDNYTNSIVTKYKE